MPDLITAGPWKWRPNRDCSLELKGAFVVDERDRELAMISARNVGSQAECEANAHLFAAAPELLEAAKHAAMEWRLHGQLTDSCRVLERAIAKAGGRA